MASAFDTLLVLSRSLTGAKQGGVLADALDLLLAGVGCARGAAYSAASDALELVGERGLPAPLRGPLGRLSLVEEPWFIAQKAARARKLVSDPEVAASDTDRRLDEGALAQSRWAQAVACPISAGRDVYGVIVLAWPASEEPDYLTLAILEVACSMLALSMARKSEERRRGEGQVDDVQAARMAALGVLARGFAEDLGEQLAELAKRVGPPLDPVRRVTTRFLSAVAPGPPERIELGALVADVLALADRHLRRRSIELQLRSSGEHFVVGRRRELLQLFLNLVLGVVGVVDDEEDLHSDRGALIRRAFAVEVALTAGHEVVSLSDVSDSDGGARSSFFDVGEHGSVTFDLAVARRIVVAHEGHIEVGPTSGSPTARVSVVLPAAATAPRAARPAFASYAKGATRPVVLWIDDDELFLEIMVQSLPDLDIRVARGATEAMQLLTFGVRPALIFCNVRLEGRPGHEVHAEITRQDRSMAERFIFVADGVVTPEIATYLIASGRPTLMRPINLDHVRALARKDPATVGRAAPTLADPQHRARHAPTPPEALPHHQDPRHAPTVPSIAAFAHHHELPPPAVTATMRPPASDDDEDTINEDREALPPAPPALAVARTSEPEVTRVTPARGSDPSAPRATPARGSDPSASRVPPAKPSEPALPRVPPAKPSEPSMARVASPTTAPPPAERPGDLAAHGDHHDPAESSRRLPPRGIELEKIARAVSDTLRRDGPKRAAVVVGMLLERGMSEREALSVITFGLSNTLFVRDAHPSTMLRAPGGEQRRVLVVDDDFDLRSTLREILQDEGYSVDTAANGQAALEILKRSNPPRVVVLDLMMPVMDGWKLLDELRRDETLVDIPVVIISASKTALRSPSQHAFLAKPIDYHKLIATIDRSMKAPPRRAGSGLV